MEQAQLIRERFLDEKAPHIDSEYMIVIPYRRKPKTWVYQVNSRKQGSELGYIKWFPRWRQYAFFPESETTFSLGCLMDVAKFIQSLTDEHRSLDGKNND